MEMYNHKTIAHLSTAIHILNTATINDLFHCCGTVHMNKIPGEE